MIEVLGDELEVLLVSFFVNVLFVTGDLSVKMFIIHDKVPRQTKAPCSYLKMNYLKSNRCTLSYLSVHRI